MTSGTSNQFDPNIAARLANLSNRPNSRPAASRPSPTDDQLALRLQKLANRNNQNPPQNNQVPPLPPQTRLLQNYPAQPRQIPAKNTQPKPKPNTKRKRRHPAKKSRIAALTLSLATTGGLAASFAAADSTPLPVVAAPVDFVTATSAVGSTASKNSTETTGTTNATGATSTTAQATSTTINGEVFSNKFGPVQVQAVFAADGSISKVTAVQVPFVDDKSVRINNRAVPKLNSEALSAQSSNVDTVSGATYTSIGYQDSLQSAIDKARQAGITEVA